MNYNDMIRYYTEEKRLKETVKISEEELLKQRDFIGKIRKFNEDYEKKNNRKRTMHISTFGCQMNAHDSEKLQGILEEMGYIGCDDEMKADVVIYNTCCVRENAENKVYGNLGYLKHSKEERPDMKIILCGCMMQQDTVIDTIRKKYRHVDIIFGTFNLYKMPELLYTNIMTGSPITDIWKEHGEIAEDLPSVRKYKYKACVNIMYGCDNFCSYCIVPYVRGRERSRRSEDILKEVRSLAHDGVKEIMLLGQNVNSYGKNLGENITFAKLLKMVNEVEGIERIRFMTSHPKDLSEELIYAIRDCDKVCKHIHLPFQAGNNEILRRMNRKYTKERYLELIGKIRKEIPGIAVTTDIMVGFPGEGRKEIEDTIDVIKKVGFSNAFTFIYSKRTGTPAAIMEDQVEEDIVKENFNDVLKALNEIILEINKEKVGKVFSVFAEEVSMGNSEFLTGKTDDNTIVHFRGSDDMLGNFYNVKITDCKTFYTVGEIVEEN